VFSAVFYFNPMGDGEDPVAPIERRALLAKHARLPVWLSRVFSVRIGSDASIAQRISEVLFRIISAKSCR
jgi:hypothetical protein